MQASENFAQYYEGNESAKDQRKKRRSKNDQDGRDHRCKHCDKTYLSDIALNNHIKTKHSHIVEIINRGRGRPRKNIPQIMNENQAFEAKYRNFFESSIRRCFSGQSFNMVTACKENFDNIYTKYKDKLFKNLDSPENYGLIECSKERTCDYSFWKYLVFISDKCNREYFDFAFKFVVLFRECINLKKGESYTQTESAEIVPDMCNDFVSDFLEAHDYFGLDVNELIDIIQHSCHWLWENHHTTSRLSLISS